MLRATMMNADDVLGAGFWEDGDGHVVFRTSGSTGEGSDVVLSRRALLLSARAVNDWLGVGVDAVWGLALPMEHVGGFGVAARAFAAGCGFSRYEGKWDAARCAEWILRVGVTHLSLVPTQVHDLLAAGLKGAPSLRAVVVGGGRLGDEAGQSARDFGWPVLASYGMTETCSQVATQAPDLLDLPYAEAPLEILPLWEAGETPDGLLKLRGEALFSGVMESGVFRAREGDWFVTKDRVSLSGNTLRPLGRADSLVKVMGELVDVEEVERKFMEIAAGRIGDGQCAVLALPDARREHRLVVAFEGEGHPECVEDYNRSVAGIVRIAGWGTVGEFPRSELGKIRRGRLAELVGRIDEMG